MTRRRSFADDNVVVVAVVVVDVQLQTTCREWSTTSRIRTRHLYSLHNHIIILPGWRHVYKERKRLLYTKLSYSKKFLKIT